MEFRFKYRFEAAHRFLNTTSLQCMTPHGHTWYATLQLQSVIPRLDQNDMVAEFSQLKSYWKSLISDVLDHSFFCNEKDPLIETLLKHHPHSRILPFPGDPTTELISLLLFHKMNLWMTQSPVAGKVKVAGVLIEETPTNSLFCDWVFYKESISQYDHYTGWWKSIDLNARNLKNVSAN